MMNLTTPRVHKVGTITAGLALVAFGILFLTAQFTNLTIGSIVAFWPLIIISIGIELLVSLKKENVIIDKASVALLIIMSLFAFCMAGLDLCLDHVNLVVTDGTDISMK